jgi:hypothetical protein
MGIWLVTKTLTPLRDYRGARRSSSLLSGLGITRLCPFIAQGDEASAQSRNRVRCYLKILRLQERENVRRYFSLCQRQQP